MDWGFRLGFHGAGLTDGGMWSRSTVLTTLTSLHWEARSVAVQGSVPRDYVEISLDQIDQRLVVLDPHSIPEP